MVFLIAKKNRAVVLAAATVTEWTIASADIKHLAEERPLSKHLQAATWGRIYKDCRM